MIPSFLDELIKLGVSKKLDPALRFIGKTLERSPQASKVRAAKLEKRLGDLGGSAFSEISTGARVGPATARRLSSRAAGPDYYANFAKSLEEAERAKALRMANRRGTSATNLARQMAGGKTTPRSRNPRAGMQELTGMQPLARGEQSLLASRPQSAASRRGSAGAKARKPRETIAPSPSVVPNDRRQAIRQKMRQGEEIYFPKVSTVRDLMKMAYGQPETSADVNTVDIPYGMVGSDPAPESDRVAPDEVSTRLRTAASPSQVPVGTLGNVTPAKNPIDREKYNRVYKDRR